MVKGFSFEDEQAFRISEQFIQPKFLRIAYILFIGLFALFSVSDRVYFPDTFHVLLIIRFVIVIPAFIIIIILTYLKTFPKIHQITIAISAWIGGAAISFMLILNPENIAYYGGLFLVYFSSYFMIKLRFVNATITGWSIFVFNMLGYLIWNSDITVTFLYSSLFFICANLIGMVGSYNLETMNRKQFLHDREITKMNDELVMQYEEKAKQFEKLEASIKENKVLQLINAEKDALAQSLRESEDQYKSLTTQMQLGVALQEIIYDDQGLPSDYRYISVNDSYLRLTGFQREDLIGKTVLEIFPNIEEFWRDFYRKVASTEHPEQAENYTLALDRYFRLSAYTPKKGMIAVIVDDISDQKEIDKERKLKEKDLLASQKVAHIGTWRLDIETNEVVWTDELYKMYGFDPTLPPPPYTEHMKLFTETSWNKLSKALDLTRFFGEPYELELEMINIYQKHGWMWVRGEAEKNDTGKIVAIWGVAQDITEQKKQQYSLVKSEEKYKLLATQMQLGLALHEVILDEDGSPIDYVFLEINESYTKLLGVTPEMCIGKKITEVMPDVEDYWIKTLGNVAVTGKSTYYENYLETTKKYYSTYTFCPQQDQFAVLVTDITDRKHLEDALNESNEKYMAIFEKSPIAIEYYDSEGKFVYANEACLALFGVIDQRELIGYSLFTNPNFSQELKDKIARFEPIRMELEFSFEKVISSKVYRTSKSGSRVLDLFITPLMNEEVVNGYIVHIEDITIEKHKQKEIEYLSYHDYLTDLYNRRYFVHSYHQFIFEEQFPLGVMMIDINGLKIINDAFGHSHGDIAIKLVSNLLMHVFDSTDIVARIGGDEFAILAPNTNSDQMQNYKNKAIDLVKKINIGNIEISLAIGYEVVEDAYHDIDELLSNAENFLYRHKITVGTSIRNHAIKAILNTLTDKYKDEKVHSQKVSQFCKAIGLALGVSKEEADVLELAGMYHDIGKISIPDAILNKPGKLTKEEFEIIKSHTQVGYQILKAADQYSGLAEYALSHHERWDGKGYPKGLVGTEIPLYSRIINIADSFEAMTADRPYHTGMSIEDAILEIKRCSGSQFDPKIAGIFIDDVLKNNE